MCLRDVAEARVVGWLPVPGEEVGVMGDDVFPHKHFGGWLAADAWYRPVARRPKRRFRYDWKRLAWWEKATDTNYRRTFGVMVGYCDERLRD
jgi:hypothetical protein